MDNLAYKENYTRLCHLLIGRGTKALRKTFYLKYRWFGLRKFLRYKKDSIHNCNRINDEQWDCLFPTGGQPDPNNFDISLLATLLETICTLGPCEKDKIVRLRKRRNEIAHATSTDIAHNKFKNLWLEISQILADLGVSQDEIETIKKSPLSPEAKRNIEKLKDRETHEKNEPKKEGELLKFNFEKYIDQSVINFHEGTRKRMFTRVETWFREESSKVLVMTAERGFGKTTLAAKIIKNYKDKDELAACHFFNIQNSNYCEPMNMLESLASQICESVVGFRETLSEQLKRPNEVNNLQDAFQVYLKEPLHCLSAATRLRLVVIDGLDECDWKEETKLLDLLAEEFPKLPVWLKVLVTSRPEKVVKEKLSSSECIQCIDISPKYR